MPSLLKGLQERTGAEWVALFRMDMQTRQVTLVQSQGAKVHHFEEAKYELEYSPVRDVIEDRDIVFARHISRENKARFQKLLPLFPCKSCIGVPVEVGKNIEHALFLFHRQPDAFKPRHVEDAYLTALRISLVLEREQYLARMMKAHHDLLLGQLASGLVHEVNNKLLAVLSKMAVVDLNVSKVVVNPKLSQRILRYISRVARQVDELEKMLNGVNETVTVFRNLMRKDAAQRIDVCTTVQQAVEVVVPEAKMAGISIENRCNPGIPRVVGRPVHLEQALVNVILNAVQQMRLIGRKGTVWVEASFEPDRNDSLPIKIRVRDQGPGIHAKLFEEIFKLGFTTRDGGTGMGLYITRALTEQMGGQVRVEESLISIGSTFVIELPVMGRKEAA